MSQNRKKIKKRKNYDFKVKKWQPFEKIREIYASITLSALYLEEPGMEQEIKKEQNISKNTDNSNEYTVSCDYTAGPLNVNRFTKQAKTVMGTDIILGEHDFEALDILVSNEGEYLSFQQLYEASWSKSQATDSIDYAFTALNNIIIQINNIGEDFMWIESKPGMGYMFKTRWGQAWKSTNTDSGILSISDFNNSEYKRKYVRRRFTKATFFTGAGTIVAAIILVLVVLYTTGVIAPTTTEPLYIDDFEIDDPDTPLAELEFDE